MGLKFLFCIAAACCAIESISQEEVDNFIKSEPLDGASTSLLFFDLITDQELQSYNKDRKLCPASAWKILTAAASADLIQNKQPFKTELFIDGNISNGTLNGNIIVKGYGDPTLGSEVFNENQMQVLKGWAELIKKEGISHINGKILADASWLQGVNLPRTRIWEDMANYYGAAISGLNFHDNSYTIRFNTRFDPGQKVELLGHYPEVPYLNLHSEVLASNVRSDRAFVFGSPLSAVRKVRGTLPSGYDNYEIKGSLPDPALFCVYHLKKELESVGIHSDGAALLNEPFTSELELISTLYSPNLDEIIHSVLVDSNNLFAEVLAAKIGESDGKGNLELGVNRIVEFYSKHCDSGNKIHGYDGSGLSRFNAISAQQFQHLISYCSRNDRLSEWVLSPLPRFGKEGTVRRMGKNTPLEGNVAAKSGSMEGVIAYCGVFNAQSGRQIGFSLLINNYECPGYQVRKEIENLLLSIYKRY